MGFCGLTPSEYSSGQRTWRGQITKTGNSHLRAQLVESAWAYQYRPAATWSCAAARLACHPRSPLEPGPRSLDCAAAFAGWRPAAHPAGGGDRRRPRARRVLWAEMTA